MAAHDEVAIENDLHQRMSADRLTPTESYLMRKAEELGVSFAFPTRTLHMADAPQLGREAGDAAEGGLERAPQAGASSPGPRRLP